MATIDPTRRAAVRWWDIDGPDSPTTRLSVCWLDRDNREMAYDIRGMHAYWIAQVFKARDTEIRLLGERIDAVSRDNTALRAETATLTRQLSIAVDALGRIEAIGASAAGHGSIPPQMGEIATHALAAISSSGTPGGPL